MIAVASSTRADWGLLAPLTAELSRRGIAHKVLASNMHLMPEMGLTVKEIYAAGETPAELHTASASTEETFAESARLHAAWMRENKPDAIIILGDRYEMLGVASAAAICGVPIVHIAGGTVSEGAMDNAMRNAISQLAALHLTETELCASRLVAMGIKSENVHVTGAIGVWNACNIGLMTRSELADSLGRTLPRHFFVGTLHAATLDSATPEEQMQAFTGGLTAYMTRHPETGAILTYPNNDTDPAPLIAQLRSLESGNPDKIIIVPSLGMRRYLSAVSLSEGVIGNSSSGIVEVASLGVPTLDVGIRQNGRERALSVIHCDCTPGAIAKGLEVITMPAIRELAARRENPYGRPDTPQIMADAIETFIKQTFERK